MLACADPAVARIHGLEATERQNRAEEAAAARRPGGLAAGEREPELAQGAAARTYWVLRWGAATIRDHTGQHPRLPQRINREPHCVVRDESCRPCRTGGSRIGSQGPRTHLSFALGARGNRKCFRPVMLCMRTGRDRASVRSEAWSIFRLTEPKGSIDRVKIRVIRIQARIYWQSASRKKACTCSRAPGKYWQAASRLSRSCALVLLSWRLSRRRRSARACPQCARTRSAQPGRTRRRRRAGLP